MNTAAMRDTDHKGHAATKRVEEVVDPGLEEVKTSFKAYTAKGGNAATFQERVDGAIKSINAKDPGAVDLPALRDEINAATAAIPS